MKSQYELPDEDSSLSSLLTSQSRLWENWVQLFLFPLINAAAGYKESVHKSNIKRIKCYCSKWCYGSRAETMSPKGGNLICTPKAKAGERFCFDTLIHINLEDS